MLLFESLRVDDVAVRMVSEHVVYDCYQLEAEVVVASVVDLNLPEFGAGRSVVEAETRAAPESYRCDEVLCSCRIGV